MRFGITILTDEPWSVTARRWVRAEELRFDHAWTFDHITWGGLPESPWYAAFPTLVAAAAATSRIGLGTFVSSPNNHHPLTLHRQAQAVHDVSGGRFILGVGAGGDLDAAVLGSRLTRGERSARFAEFVDVLEALWTSDHVTYSGRWFSTSDARTQPAPLRPNGTGDGTALVPVYLAANGPRAIRLVASRGDGWITYGGNGAESDDDWWRLVAEVSARMDEALAQAGREPATLRRVLSIDGSPVYSLSSLDCFEEAVGRADELGFTDVVTHWPRRSDPYRGDESVLEAVAAEVLPRWR